MILNGRNLRKHLKTLTGNVNSQQRTNKGIKMFKQFYILEDSTIRKRYRKERFLDIFKSMRDPKWNVIMYEHEDKGELAIWNKDGVVRYVLIGTEDDIIEIGVQMTEYIFKQDDKNDN